MAPGPEIAVSTLSKPFLLCMCLVAEWFVSAHWKDLSDILLKLADVLGPHGWKVLWRGRWLNGGFDLLGTGVAT